jgi:hypothetical protein
MKNKYILYTLGFIALVLPIVVTLRNVLSGGMPFWYDPARDFLSASANLSNLTLIGPTTGIPGIFYGPYWIWLLSIGLLISKDPRIVNFTVQTVPYLFVLSFLLYRLSLKWGRSVSILIWVLFIFGFMEYLTYPWNPHLAPLFAFSAVYLILTTDFGSITKQVLLKALLVGVLSGLVINFHISFGLGFVIGVLLFVITTSILIWVKSKKRTMQNFIRVLSPVIAFIVGFGGVFLPFIVFEMRHDFQQIKTILATLLSPGAVVGQKGFSDLEIIQSFFGTFGDLLLIPHIYAYSVFTLMIVAILFLAIKRQITFSHMEKKLILLILFIGISILGIYLTSKNPVWGYHFVGVEILFIFVLALIAHKIAIFRYVLLIWVGILLITQSIGFVQSFSIDYLSFDTLKKKEYIVQTIASDAGDNSYTVYIYNPGIYTYDFAYLFQWLAHKNVPYDPGQIKKEGDTIYLVIPKTSQAIFDDFVNYRSPKDQYMTANTWNIADGTVIIRREKTDSREQ